ncbi:Hypothetical predicted protein [Mytilus galloprovincialis]|uniref:B box-type domain-containing protein n=1 Tax=Mytilus galloprovincialis TaxID=29158 RepID=A0A8B6E6F3_MYTGA|nr:Hypothetical predicted protein [Mytilus galloprovincialis]
MAQYTAPICQICIGGQAGEHYCRQCEQLFCGNCKSSHLRTKISKNHTFVSGPNINKEEKLLCTEHEESFLFYCHDCETPVCRICSVKKHSRHLMTDLTETTLELKSEVSKVIISKITASQLNISRIKEETKTYREEVKVVIKTITDEANYWKQLIDKKVEALIKEVQNKEHKEIQNMSTYSEVNEGVVENCETWQKDIKTMETTADILLFKKLKQLKPEVDQIVLKPIPNAPFVSYRNKKPLSTDLDSLFGKLSFCETKAITGKIDNQQSAR